VFLAAVIPFGPALTAGFVGLDDHSVLLNVTGYRGFAAENLRWMFTTTHMGHYQPLTWLSYAVDHALWGMDPRGYHATNVLIHAVNAVLVYVLAGRLIGAARPGWGVGRRVGAAAAGAVLWAVHPLRVESVAWVTERRDVLSTMFLLGAALAYVRAVGAGGVGVSSWRAYGVAVVLLLLSLLSKAWGMTFFVVMLVVDVYPLRRVGVGAIASQRGFRLVMEKAPFALLGLVFVVVAGYAQRSTGKAVASLDSWTVMDRALQGVYGLMFYVWKTVAPTGLTPMYEKPAHMDPASPGVIAAMVVVVGVVAGLVAVRRRAPAAVAAAVAYLVIVSPVLGVFQSGPQLVADRYSYVAMIGVFIAIGGGLVMLIERLGASGRRSAIAGAGVVTMVLIGASWAQAVLWRDNDRLLGRIIEKGHAGPAVMLSYADALANRGQLEESIPVYQKILEQTPAAGTVWTSLGQVQRRLGRFAEAEASLRRGLENNPEAWQPAVELALMYLKEDELNRPMDALLVLRFAIEDVERPGRPPGLTPGGGGRPYLLMAIALDLTGNGKAGRPMLEKAAEFPALREEATRLLRELEGP